VERDCKLRAVDVDRRSIGYREAGRGDALVLLHGFLCDSRCWRPQLATLSDRFRVIAWDAPGAGSSPDPPDTFRTADWAHCLARFLDALDVDRAHVVGLSWGGILAQELYRLYAARIRTLVLADTYAGWKGSLGEHACDDRLAMCLDRSTRPPHELVAEFIPGMFTDDVAPEIPEALAAIMSEFRPAGFRLMSISSAEMDTRDLLPTIDVPTLVLWGADDRRSPVLVAEQMSSAIPGAELVVIPNAGHVSNMEQPAAFDEHVRRFCSIHDG
jgi:pimeloyl-ACP methyl ester carboxylesterase